MSVSVSIDGLGPDARRASRHDAEATRPRLASMRTCARCGRSGLGQHADWPTQPPRATPALRGDSRRPVATPGSCSSRCRRAARPTTLGRLLEPYHLLEVMPRCAREGARRRGRRAHLAGQQPRLLRSVRVGSCAAACPAGHGVRAARADSSLGIESDGGDQGLPVAPERRVRGRKRARRPAARPLGARRAPALHPRDRTAASSGATARGATTPTTAWAAAPGRPTRSSGSAATTPSATTGRSSSCAAASASALVRVEAPAGRRRSTTGGSRSPRTVARRGAGESSRRRRRPRAMAARRVILRRAVRECLVLGASAWPTPRAKLD